MPIADFQDFCESLCALTGVDAPRLEPDEDGTIAFTIAFDEAEIGFIQTETGGEVGALMVADFGVPDETNELKTLRGVLDTNFIMSSMGAPVFVRNPATGVIALHRACYLARLDIQDVYKAMMKTVEAVSQWKRGRYFNAPTTTAAARGSFAAGGLVNV